MVVIRELLDRMRHGDFHQARTEAARIADLDALEQIRTILERTRDAVEKMYCYRMLGDLGRNTKATQVADYLMERVAAEKTVKLRKLALSEVSLLQGVSNAENAMAALTDKNRDVRLAAIDALGACRGAESEAALLGIVNSGDDSWAAWKATMALLRIGTHQCVDSLIALFRRLPRNRQHEDTVALALLALARLGATDSLRLAVEELNASRSGSVNWACMLVVWQRGDEAHIDVVVRRLEALIKRKNRPDIVYTWSQVEAPFEDEFTAGVSFLQKFADARVDGFWVFLREHLPLLFERERRFLATSVKGFEAEGSSERSMLDATRC